MRDPAGRIFYGWWIVLAFFVLNVYWAGTLISGLTVFFTPLRHSFGWSAALVAFIFSLTNVLTSLLAPLVGVVFDRVGPRGLMLGAGLASGAGLIAVSRATSLPLFIPAWLVVSGGFGIWASGTGLGAASLWFVRRRGLAMGVILSGVAVGGLLVPLWKLAVDTAGWRTAFVLAGLLLWLVSVPSSLLLRHKPADLGLLPDGVWAVALDTSPSRTAHEPATPDRGHLHTVPDITLGDALRTRLFWTIAAVSSLVLAGSTAAVVLMLPRLDEAHLDSSLAVAAVTVVTLLGAVARLASGFFSDRVDPVLLAALTCVLQAAGLTALATAPERLPVLLIFVLAFGLGADNIRLLAAMILARAYGPAAFGRIQGLLYVVLLPGRVLGPVLAGALHDAGHGYGGAFALFAALTLLMLPLVLTLRQRPVRG